MLRPISSGKEIKMNITDVGALGAPPMSMAPVDPAFAAQTRVPQIMVGTLLPFGIATVFVLARFYSRAIIMKNWGQDDSWILLSWLISIALTAVNIVLAVHGAGRHFVVQKPDDLGISLLYGFLGRILYQLALWTTKLAICAFYRRVFQDRWSKIYVWTMMAAICVYSFPLIMGAIFQCRPIDGAWKAIPAKCASNVPPLYASALLNILADIALLIFVIPKILGLQIAKKQKISLLVIVGLSVLAIIAAIVRIARVVQVANSKDVSWDSYDIEIWSSVEVNTGIFCASVAAIKPLIRKMAPGMLTNSDHTTRSTSISRSKAGTYGTGTSVSRRGHNMGNGAIELSSQTDLEDFSPTSSATTNKFWTERQKTSSSDDSERGVLGLEATKGEIRKTVSVTVAAHNAEDLEMGRVDRVRKFEHV